jgi:uncharacterized protein (TIGR03086 family)
VDTLDALAQTFDHAATVISGVRSDQLGAATPCSEWDVRALLTHTIGVVTNVGCGVRGEDLLPDINAIALADDLAGQFRAAADGTLAAWRAVNLADEVNIGAGPMPGALAIQINLVDTTSHAWDIARATGQAEELPAELAATVLAAAQGFVNDDIRSYAGIKSAVAVGSDATPTETFVAFMGRQP